MPRLPALVLMVVVVAAGQSGCCLAARQLLRGGSVGSVGSVGSAWSPWSDAPPAGDIVEQEESMRGRQWEDGAAARYGAFDPADCVLHSREDLAAASSIGNRLMYRRNFRASRDCFHTALQSWWAGIQQRPEAYLGKKGPSSREINHAVQQLHLGKPGSVASSLSSSSAAPTTTPSAPGAEESRGEGDDRPQVPPQLVYMHKLKEQNARSARSKDERDSGKSTPPPSAAGNAGVVAPRAVRERTTKHMAQQEQEKQKVAAVRSAKLPELKAKRKGGPSPFDGYQGLDPEETLKGIESLSPAEQIKRLQAAAVNPALKHSSRTFSMGPYGRR